jgi:hypothetical protein
LSTYEGRLLALHINIRQDWNYQLQENTLGFSSRASVIKNSLYY